MFYFLQSTLEGFGHVAMREYSFATEPTEYLERFRADQDLDHPIPEEIEIGSKIIYQIFDIFISYSSKDALAVMVLVLELVGRGYSIYVDCFDPTLNPRAVDRQTAEIIRRRMVQSRSLFVATTQHAPASDWVPWELGFTDGLTNKAATLFIAPDEKVDFGRQSYFSLYPEVRRGSPNLGMGADLIIADPQASPPWQSDWNHWLMPPRRH